jgi:hypothetical protein
MHLPTASWRPSVISPPALISAAMVFSASITARFDQDGPQLPALPALRQQLIDATGRFRRQPIEHVLQVAPTSPHRPVLIVAVIRQARSIGCSQSCSDIDA